MTARYKFVDAALIRVALHHNDALPPWPDLYTHTPEYVHDWQRWLQAIWEHEALAEAIEVASPMLAGRVAEVCAGNLLQPRQVRRVVESVLRYVLRATTRATPFGFFAGIAPVRLAATANVHWGGKHRSTTRLDATWLDEMISSLRADHDVLCHLPVVVNELGYQRGDRWVIECQPHPNGDGCVGEISVRYTPAVRAAVDAARSPVTVGRLADRLVAQFPTTPPATIEVMLSKLVKHRVLLTRLAAPTCVTDPLGHLTDQLSAVPDDAGPPALRERLHTVRSLLDRHDQAPCPRDRRTVRTQLAEHRKFFHDRGRSPVAVDVRADCTVVLPEVVEHEARVAAWALLRLSPDPFGKPAWQAWHARFLDRWGAGAVVPLQQAIDADVGLGYPASYRGSVMAASPSPVTARDRRLLHLAQQAALDGCGEVTLDDAAIEWLAGDQSEDRSYHVAPHTELRFTLHAESTRALDRREFSLMVVSAARYAGTTIGRFLHLLDEQDRDRMVTALTNLPTLQPGSRRAQVSSPPLTARTANLARSPAFLPVIPIGEHHDDPTGVMQITVDELAISADPHRLFLVWLPTGQVVEPMITSAVELHRTSHPLARFLSEITTATAAVCVPFDWGVGQDLPFLPRVRYRKSVLHPARWQLAPDDLPGRRAGLVEWKRGFRAVQDRYRIPSKVHLGNTDVRVRLDLSQPAHLAVLRSHMDRTGIAVLTEAPADDELGWIGGRAHEIVLPLATTQTSYGTCRPITPARTVWHAGHLPGRSEWLYARVYGHPDRQTEVVTVHLPQLLSGWDEDLLVDWWFVRYHEPEPHLRVRFRLAAADRFGEAVARLGGWAEQARHQRLLRGLTLDTYHPEVGRYGTGAAMRLAETVFAADSAATLSQLTLTTAGQADPLAVTVASWTDLVATFIGNVEQGMAWLADKVPHRFTPATPRPVYHQAVSLADPTGDWEALRAAGGEQVVAAWQRRRKVIADYRHHLDHHPGPSTEAVLTSLLHLHHARMVGIVPDSERRCLHLARAAALRWAAGTSRRSPSPTTSSTSTLP